MMDLLLTILLYAFLGGAIKYIDQAYDESSYSLRSAGTLAVMAALISTPGVSQLFGCTPVGPIGWAQAGTAAAAAGALPALAPELVDRIAARIQSALGTAGITETTDPEPES